LDTLVVTETWVRESEPDTIKLDLAPPGYAVLHVDRGMLKQPAHGSLLQKKTKTKQRRGGFVLIYRTTLVIFSLHTKDLLTSSYELLIARLGIRNKSITLIAVYRPPNTSLPCFV